jgi:serine/threonine protein kinase
MMKKISEGYNNHIVNLVGCVTIQEPLCLITEFVPHGDLLDYLRNQRKKVHITII